MTNAHLADTFDLIADLLEFQGANAFRVRAYRNAARTIRDLPESIAAIVEDPERALTDIAGIGDDLAEKCQTLIETGELPMLAQLKQEVPESVLALMRIPGLGPKKAAVLHRELAINSLDELRAACESHRVRELKGFGAKTEETILAGMALAAAADQRILWCEADVIVQAVLAHMQGGAHLREFTPAGSYRRGRETVGDLDFLAVSDDADAVMDRFVAFPDVAEVIARGDTKLSLRLRDGFQMDLRVVAPESYGAALVYFTGSKQHNVELRGLAKDHGLKINEYGVYRVQGDDETYVAGASEKDVYAALALPVFEPEIRESRREFQWAAQGPLPQLVRLEDMQGDLHMHTTATDGKATLREMADAAIARGLKYIAVTDHSQRVSMANGLNAARLLAQWQEIDELNEALAGRLLVLKGIECDILEKGGMDLPDDVLAQADWVIGSVHYGQKQPAAQITARIVEAIENPHVDMIAHPTGRLLNRREPYEVDLEAVFAAAKQHRKLLELNANPLRLDLNDVHCAAAQRHGVPIVINTDAHSTSGLDVMRYGILQARRGGLTKADVANTRSWLELQKLLGPPKS
ncbi:MAG: DNA polymerase/3'-5' exonuclease PolX [Planctomycetales bacterium]|nr:DNA polymerase/3'-5' exonuclease PolX [Planctomycetales bacterium]